MFYCNRFNVCISIVPPSIRRQYLVVVFRDKPLELWDIRTGTLLREMAKNFPTVTALVHKQQNLQMVSMYAHVEFTAAYLKYSCLHIYFNRKIQPVQCNTMCF